LSSRIRSARQGPNKRPDATTGRVSALQCLPSTARRYLQRLATSRRRVLG